MATTQPPTLNDCSADPHCTCPDCMEAFIEQQEAAIYLEEHDRFWRGLRIGLVLSLPAWTAHKADLETLDQQGGR